MEARVPPMSLNSKASLLEESPGGTMETKMPSATKRMPRPPQIQTPGMPPGTRTAFWVGGAVGAAGELDDSGEHVDEGNEVEDDGGVDEELICAAGGFADLADEEDAAGEDGLDEDGDVRGLPFGMDAAEGGGQIAVDADDEGDARDAGDCGADSAGVACGDEDGGEDSEEAEA
jgi:hypothetical protein